METSRHTNKLEDCSTCILTWPSRGSDLHQGKSSHSSSGCLSRDEQLLNLRSTCRCHSLIHADAGVDAASKDSIPSRGGCERQHICLQAESAHARAKARVPEGHTPGAVAGHHGAVWQHLKRPHAHVPSPCLAQAHAWQPCRASLPGCMNKDNIGHDGVHPNLSEHGCCWDDHR